MCYNASVVGVVMNVKCNCGKLLCRYNEGYLYLYCKSCKEEKKIPINKIRLLTSKYNDLCKASGLLPKKQRMSVSGYRRVKT